MSSKKEDLLNKAEILFYEHSFHSIGLKRVINEANVAVMTLYNHFASKEDLIMEVLKEEKKILFISGCQHYIYGKTGCGISKGSFSMAERI